MKRIAAVTMVRNDEFFLRRWVEYYGRELGKENLYVYFDGEDQEIPGFCDGDVHTCLRPKAVGDVRRTDRDRATFLSARAADLFSQGYDMVLGTDVDEFLVADPATGCGLRKFLSRLPEGVATWSGLGVDVGQTVPLEPPIEDAFLFLRQRSRGWLHARYTKATAMCRPGLWGSGFHRMKGKNFHIAKDLYLFHFGGVDLRRLQLKCGTAQEMGQGWDRHLRKRARTILMVSDCKVRPWTPTVDRVRRLQTFLRPVFALNKPSTYGLRFVVEIPQRFKTLV